MHGSRFHRTLSTVLFVVTATIVQSVAAENPSWPQFLGPHRNGISSQKNLMSQWPTDGPQVLWRAPGGVGMSAVAVSGNRAITMWNSQEGQVVAALNSKDGTPVWKTSIAKNYENGQGDGPRGTPAIVADRVFAYSGDGILACLHLGNGELIWSKDVVTSVKTRPAEYGMACSPLVVDDMVIVTAGGTGTAVVALDTKTGETKWTAGNGTPGYSSPAMLDVAGEQQLVAFTGAGVMGIRPDDGSLLWSYPFKTPYDCNTATPISVDGNVFISAGENHGCVMLKVTKENDDYAIDVAWESVDVKSVLRSEWQTPVLIDGHLYGFDNVGSAGPTTHLTCVNAQTGETAWTKSRFGKGNLVAAGTSLWITTMKGELVLAEANSTDYVELGRQTMFGKTRQTPSIAEGKAFIRDDNEVICFDLSR